MKKLLLVLLMGVMGISVSMAQSVRIGAAGSKKTAPAKPMMHRSLVTQQAKKEAKAQIAPYAAFALNQDAKVISSVSRGDKTIQLVKNANGTLSKKIVQNEPIQKLNRKSTVSANKSTADNTLFESFEGWDGVSSDWTPDGWSRDNKTELETWEMSEATVFGVVPTDGDYMAWINLGTIPGEEGDIPGGDPRNEMLISPAFTPVAGDILYFDVSFAALWMFLDVNLFDFTFDDPVFNLEILVSEDNGTSWSSIYNIAKSEDLFDRELLFEYEYMDNEWYTLKLPIDAYIGKSIKVAFHYTDRDGGDNIGLDNIAVREPNPTALYKRPQGYFYIGLSPDRYPLTNNFMLGAAYTPATWDNLSVDADSYSWKLADPDDPDATIVSTEVNPTLTYPFYQSLIPVLTVNTNTGKSSTYSWGKNEVYNLFQTGGNFNGISGKDFGAGNYDLTQGIALPRFAVDQYCFGTNNTVNIKSVANYFEKPVHKYFITKAWIYAITEAPAGTEFTLTIHRVNDQGNITDVIATSTCRIEDVVDDMMLFNEFYIIDPETELDVMVDYLEIEDAILVELSGFYDVQGVSFGAVSQVTNTTIGGESNAYVKIVNQGTERWLNSANYLVNGATSLLFSLDVTYSFLLANSNTFDVSEGGGEKTFDVTSYYSPDGWWLEEELPEWLSDDLEFDSNTWDIQYTLRAEPLPANTTSREAIVKIVTFGADMSIKVQQGTTGIPVVTAANTKVVNRNGNFELTYTPDYSVVSVYNVAGQKIAGYRLPATGTFTIPAGNYPKGVYLINFTGAKGASTVKMMK